MSKTRPTLFAIVSAAVLGLSLAGCATPYASAPAASPRASASAPVSSSPAPLSARPAERARQTFRPRLTLWDTRIPPRFEVLQADAPEVVAVPAMAAALRNGSGALAIDRATATPTGYRPTLGGLCGAVQSQTDQQLAEEMKQAITPSAVGPIAPNYAVQPFGGGLRGKIVGRYQMQVGETRVHVTQVGQLAAPGKVCVLTMSTDDPVRDAIDLSLAESNFMVRPA